MQAILENSIFNKFLYFSVDTSDGFQKEEQGEIKNAGTDEESLAVTGSYSYVGDDGKTYSVKYTADENGFQPEGEHIPPSAGVKKPKVGIPPAAIASLAGWSLFITVQFSICSLGCVKQNI